MVLGSGHVPLDNTALALGMPAQPAPSLWKQNLYHKSISEAAVPDPRHRSLHNE